MMKWSKVISSTTSFFLQMHKYTFEWLIEKINFQHKGDSTNEQINHSSPEVIRSGSSPACSLSFPAALIMSPIVKCLPRDIAQHGSRSFWDTDGNKNVYLTVDGRFVEHCVANSYWAVLIYARVFHGSDRDSRDIFKRTTELIHREVSLALHTSTVYFVWIGSWEPENRPRGFSINFK